MPNHYLVVYSHFPGLIVTFAAPSGILRSIILSQLAPHRLSKAPVGPLIPLAELLEEVSGCSVADGAHYGTGGSFDDDEPVSPGYEQHSMSSMAEGQSYVGEPEAAAMRDSISLQVG